MFRFSSLLNVTTGLTTGYTTADVALALILGVVLTFAITFAVTTCQFVLASMGDGGRFKGREPPTLPYFVPYLGSMFSMQDPHVVYEYAAKKSPNRWPLRLQLGILEVYLVFGAKNVQFLFKNSKILSKDSSVVQLSKGMGVPAADLALLALDDTGMNPSSTLPADRRIWQNTHNLYAVHLATGAAVNVLTEKFMTEFLDELDQEPEGQWTKVPVYEFLQNRMFRAGVIALTGTKILELNPDLAKIYWDFDACFLKLAVGLPRFVYRKEYAARDRMAAAVKKFLASAYETYDFENDTNPAWEENFGARIFKEEVLALKNYGLSIEGQAASLLLLIWATHSNAIPCATWALMEILQRPGLLDRVRAEASTAAITDPTTGRLRLDIPKLLNLPLLSSIYQECLRIRASVTVARQLVSDTEIDGYMLKGGSFVMSPTWLPHNDPESWSVEGHPAKSFWPERFMEQKTMGGEEARKKFVAAMKPESFFPYGGGNAICPGRFFAKQEILVAIALVVLKFEIEPVGFVKHDGTASDRGPELEPGYAGSGFVPPDRDLMLRMRRIVK